jgi:hypothetical protein
VFKCKLLIINYYDNIVVLINFQSADDENSNSEHSSLPSFLSDNDLHDAYKEADDVL